VQKGLLVGTPPGERKKKCSADFSATSSAIPRGPFQFDAAWLAGPGATAVAQARAIYDKGRFADLPSLAETLERAGCHDSAVLDHCREPSIHIRGCWVVDALLGRESAVRFGLMTETDWHTCGDPKPLLHILRDKGSNRKWRLFAVACCRRINRLIVDEPSRRAVEVAMRYADGEATEAEVEAARTAAYQAVEEAGRAEDDAEAEANFDMTPEDAAACCRSSAARAAWATLAADTRVSAAEPDSFEARRWCPSDDSAAYACGKNVYVSMEMVQSGDAVNAAEAAERTAHCDLLRDLFGDAFGPPGEEGSWLDFGSHLLFPENRPEQWRLLPTRRNTVLHRECLLWSEGRVRKLTQAIYDENAFDRLPILADAFRVAERFAEGQATVEELEMAHEAAGEAAGDAEEPQERDAAHAAEAASDPSEHLGILTSDYAMDAAGHLVRQAQHSLLLELLGPPFRPVDINPAWLTWNYGTVQKIAQAISDERAFDRMPILADALEEASCANQDILTHCRQPGEHVRGCWAVDLILGRP